MDLCNEGAPETMIEPGRYGRVITVRRDIKRTVSADGKVTISNKFCVINKDTGKTVAEGTKADKIGEFVAIRERLNIDVTNPVVCMDQELSKKFITGDARDFYRAFMDATLLQRDYNLILEAGVRAGAHCTVCPPVAQPCAAEWGRQLLGASS